MPAPRAPRRKKNADHIFDAVLGLETAEQAIARIDDARLSNDGRNAVMRLRKALTDGKSAAADAIETMADGTLTRDRRPPDTSPLFSDGSRT